ncbi:MAG: hypothetical protein KHX55_06895 [Proteobacteria bacterium]|nr:hypothetical protein [Pseudomonadota bacterium]
MPSKPQEAEEYKRYLEFAESKEYQRLTQGEDAVFRDYNPQSADDIRQLRDYIYNELPPTLRTTEFTNVSSLSITRMQVGMALIARDEYRDKLAKEPKPRRRIGSPAATTGKSGYVGRIKGFDASRRVRC